MLPTKTIVNALTIDVEDYFHVHAFKNVIRQKEWGQFESRVVPSTHRILKLLAAHQTRATFFILGWVAEQHPALVREIAAAGHEIASHGYAHQAVHELTQKEFREDLDRANTAIRAAYPQAEILGYRAPSFSINQTTPWAYEELLRAGFCYDSSVSPATTHDQYGVPNADRFTHEVARGLLEIPPSTVRFFKNNFPAVGGGHFRFAPLALSKWATRRINREGHPVVTYLHPWEFDPKQPRVSEASLKSKFRHYLNLSKTEHRLSQLLEEFPFDRMDRVFANELAANTPMQQVAQ